MSDNTTEEEPRGPGAPKGRRPVVWITAAVVGCTCGKAELKAEKISVKDQDPDSLHGSFPQEEAERLFKSEHSVNPVAIYGPLYDKKGGQPSKVRRKRGSISRDIADMRLCRDKKQRHGIWEGWHGMACYIEDDEEKVYFCFVREVEPDPEKTRKPPAPGKVNISELVFESEEVESNNNSISM
jgi:hypothetical protein